MLSKWSLIGAITLIAAGGHAVSAAQPPGQSLEEVLANCDPATGLPRGVKRPVGSAPGAGVVMNPGPLIRPDARAVAASYPKAAGPTRANGKVVISCLVAVDGRTRDCQVVEETPPSLGFADAGLQLAGQMVFVPKRLNCQPVDGAKVVIPFSFMPPKAGRPD